MFLKFAFSLLLISDFSQPLKDNIKDYRSHPKWPLVDVGDQCGYSPSMRIIGGSEADLGQFPWMAFLVTEERLDSRRYKRHYCSGSLINENYVLTAGHCCKKSDQNVRRTVYLGEHKRSTDPDCILGVCAPPVQAIEVEVIPHEKFVSSQADDICLVRLRRPAVFSEYVSPICLPYFQPNLTDIPAEIAGWGRVIGYIKGTSDTLRFGKVNITSNTLCNLYRKRQMTEYKVCYTGADTGDNGCNGDSGGPLMSPVAMDGLPRYFLIGIISYGSSSCKVSPSVCTYVPKYMDWILDNISE